MRYNREGRPLGRSFLRRERLIFATWQKLDGQMIAFFEIYAKKAIVWR
jgi:hypothetical protein